jgi:hypothetical protein
VAVVSIAATLTGCDRGDREATPSAPSAVATRPRRSLEIVMAPSGAEPLSAIVARERIRAKADGRELLIYVGAAWCEPCTRFHDAAVAGTLDARFGDLRLIEFDRDRDEARLREANCLSRMIPLFAKPDASGRCSDQRIMGSIKGPGAVANIAPRLDRLLGR